MSTALTAFFIVAVPSGTLATASAMGVAAGGANSSRSTTVGTSTGYGELWSLGTATAWGAGGSAPAPSGNGFLLDATTLELQQFVAGNWTPTVRLQMATAAQSLTADIIVRWYRRSSGGVYNAISSQTLTAQNLTNTATTYALAAINPGQSATFVTGDKLYCDVLLNITATTGTTGASQIKIVAPSTGSLGVATFQLVSPGFQSAAINLTATANGVGSASGTLKLTNILIASTGGNGGASGTLKLTNRLIVASGGNGGASGTLKIAYRLSALAGGNGGGSGTLHINNRLSALAGGNGGASGLVKPIQFLTANISGGNGGASATITIYPLGARIGTTLVRPIPSGTTKTL